LTDAAAAAASVTHFQALKRLRSCSSTFVSCSLNALLLAVLFAACIVWHRLAAKQVTALQLGSSLVRYVCNPHYVQELGESKQQPNCYLSIKFMPEAALH
jgi:hypothetical protein